MSEKLLNSKNLTRHLKRHALQNPNKDAVFIEQQAVNYKDFDNAVDQCAFFLSQIGIVSGSNVTLHFTDEYKLLVCLFAAARIGATVTNITDNTPVLQQQKIISILKCRYLITDNQNYSTDLDIQTIIFDDYHTASLDNTLLEKVYDLAPNAPRCIGMGSGTTGNPKWIPVYHNDFDLRSERIAEAYQLTEADRLASLIELSFSYTQYLYMSAISFGTPIVIFNRQTANAATFIDDLNISILDAAVVNCEKILQQIKTAEQPLWSSLRYLVLTYSTVSDSLRSRVAKTLTPNLIVVYGANECGLLSYSMPDTTLKVSNSVGSIFNSVKLEIIDDNNKVLTKGEIGQIRIQAPGMITQYPDDKPATDKAFSDGWFFTGDLGLINEENTLVHLGRSDLMMIMNGINIYPAEIEKTMGRHPAVEDCVALPIYSKIYQEIPVCAVVLKNGFELTEEELLDYCYEQIGSHGAKHALFINEIPKTPQGKLKRKQLIAELEDFVLSKTQKPSPIALSNKYKQSTYIHQISLKQNLADNLNVIDKFISLVFDIETTQKLNRANIHPKNKFGGLGWRYLLIRRELLQAAKMPVFDIGNVLSIDPQEDRVVLVLKTPVITGTPKNIYTNVNNLTLAILKQSLTNFSNPPRLRNLYKEIQQALHKIKQKTQQLFPGKSTLPILQSAHHNKIPFEYIGSGFYQLGWGSKSKIMTRSASWEDSHLGTQLSENKVQAANRLRMAGLPAPQHSVANNLAAAIKVSHKLGYPVVTKPLDLNRGEGVSVDIYDDQQLEIGFKKANVNNKAVIVEKQVQGVCTRIFIANNKMYYAVMRLPKSVIGDGQHSIQQLIDIANHKNRKQPPWKRTEPFPLDDEALTSIKNAGFELDSVVQTGEIITLRRIESTQDGGYDQNVTDSIHPNNIELAIQAARLFGLKIAGVDIISPDITQPWYQNGAIVNEVNFAPLYGGGEIAKSTIPQFLQDTMHGDGRIPITVVIGADCAMQKAKEIQSGYISNGSSAFISSHNQTFDHRQNEFVMPLNSLFQRTKALLMNQMVEALILVIENDEWLNSGVPIDCINELIITNQNAIKPKQRMETLVKEINSRL